MAIKVTVGNVRSIKVVINGSKQRAKIGSAVGRNPLKVFGQYLNTLYQFALSSLGVTGDQYEHTVIDSIDVTMLKSGTPDVDFTGDIIVSKKSFLLLKVFFNGCKLY